MMVIYVHHSAPLFIFDYKISFIFLQLCNSGEKCKIFHFSLFHDYVSILLLKKFSKLVSRMAMRLHGMLSSAVATLNHHLSKRMLCLKQAMSTPTIQLIWGLNKFEKSLGGVEIELIAPVNGEYVPYEIKLAGNIKPRFYQNIQYWLKLSNQPKQKGYLITNCLEKVPLPHNITNHYWKDL